MAHILKFRMKKEPINYLDDYFMATLLRQYCNWQINVFMDICADIHFLVILEKTFWADTQTTFLGFLLNTLTQTVSVPREKIIKGTNMIESVLGQQKHKATVYQIQKICGFLNFLSRAIIPGL